MPATNMDRHDLSGPRSPLTWCQLRQHDLHQLDMRQLNLILHLLRWTHRYIKPVRANNNHFTGWRIERELVLEYLLLGRAGWEYTRYRWR